MALDDQLATALGELHDEAEGLAWDMSDGEIEIGSGNLKDAKELLERVGDVLDRIRAMREWRRPMDLIDAALFRIRA